MRKFTQIFKAIPTKVRVILILIILGVLVFWLWSRPNAQITPQLIPVQTQDLRSTISSSGILTGREVSNLKFKSSGKLSSLAVRPGDRVKRGQFIATLNTQELSIRLQQAQNTLRDKQAIVDKTLDDLKNHDKDETYAQRQTRTAAEVARDNAYDEVKLARRAFEDSTIYAPIDGIVTSQSELVVGQNISASDLIAQVVNFSEQIFVADIDEADISQIKIGQQAEVTLNAYEGQIFNGQVREIIPQTQTSSSGATTVTVKIALAEATIVNINGLNGQVSIITSQSSQTLTIPEEALIEEVKVLVQVGDSFETKEVKTGIKTAGLVEVLSGLKKSDRIVTNAQLFVKNASSRKSDGFESFGRFFRLRR